mmetsp:Transcript_6427/g.15599  ORF Transcript_6427/g.15599 Transcript_6427/m.15599 type:complete len:453 (-) Transcript_6427:617-1975(-)|eukprot:CAMPEP_0116089406 /NCGR_PEP_ID=MMETSP0327-20121206/6407_1 /TAXON_ID=44447 /ORGANISM="Pseudo-nitzschia delicatissima, Strain B596" /LENGTH=452 /DNA_ID=CAMNT_0003580593 /DNA_START=74 /DNA_END=1432 /DNA_ORIENTATION=-
MCASSTNSNSDQSRMHPALIPDDVSSDVSARDYPASLSNINSTEGDHLLSEDQGLSTTLQAGEIRRKRKVDDISSVNVIPRTPRSSKLSKAESISSNAMESTQQMSALQRMMTMEEANRAETNDYRALEDLDPCFHKQVWRERVAQWCYDVLDYLEESRDVAAVAMNIIDRYLAVLKKESSTSLEIGEFDYEVISFTALFLAIRVSGSNKELEISELLKLSSRSGAPQVKHIVSAGSSMLEKLSWNRQLLTPNSFLRELFSLLMSQHEKEDASKAVSRESLSKLVDFASYLVEISVCDIYFSVVAPSKIAFGALALAMMCNSELFSTGCRHEEFLSRFFQSVYDQTSMNIECPQMNSILSRLLHVYNQSQDAAVQNIEIESFQLEGSANDGTYDTGAPHIIVDEEEDSSVTNPRMVPSNKSDRLIDLNASGLRVNTNTKKTRPVSPLPPGIR